MGFEKFLFYVFSLIALWASGMVVTRRNPVHAVLFLVLAFVTSAALWILLQAEFLGIVLVLVYVGAVMVLFLFVVMMLDVDVEELYAGFVRHFPLGVFIAAIMAFEIFLVVGPENFGLSIFPKPDTVELSNTRELGLLLYTVYVYPVEIASAILLVAIVAAIRLTLRRRPENKNVDPASQVKIKKGLSRIRIVKMPSESPSVSDDLKKEGNA